MLVIKEIMMDDFAWGEKSTSQQHNIPVGFDNRARWAVSACDIIT